MWEWVRGANHPPCPTSSTRGWEVGCDRPAPALCLPPWGYLAVCGGRVSEMHTSWALACEGDGVGKRQEHKARKPQGKSQAVIFFPTGFLVIGSGRGSVRGSGHVEGQGSHIYQVSVLFRASCHI